MKFKDEEIIRLRNDQKKRKYINSNTGMYVGESLLKFREMELFKIYHIKIPEIFDVMDLELALRKYPSIHRPQFILSDQEGEVNLAFNFYDSAVEPGTTEGTLSQFKTIIRAANPSSRFLGQGSMDGIRYHCSWFEFTSASLDGGVSNMMSLVDLKEHFILAMFNCPEQEGLLWKPLLLEVLSTIDKKEDGE